MSWLFCTIADSAEPALNQFKILVPHFIYPGVKCSQFWAAIAPNSNVPGGRLRSSTDISRVFFQVPQPPCPKCQICLQKFSRALLFLFCRFLSWHLFIIIFSLSTYSKWNAKQNANKCKKELPKLSPCSHRKSLMMNSSVLFSLATNGMLIRWGWPGKLGTCYPHEIPQVPSGSKTLPSYYISINTLKIIWTCSTYNSNLRKMDRCFLQTYSETTMKYSQNIIATGNIFSGCLMEPS